MTPAANFATSVNDTGSVNDVLGKWPLVSTTLAANLPDTGGK
jgi:hypothetical protein